MAERASLVNALRPDQGIVVDGKWFWLPDEVYAFLQRLASEQESE